VHISSARGSYIIPPDQLRATHKAQSNSMRFPFYSLILIVTCFRGVDAQTSRSTPQTGSANTDSSSLTSTVSLQEYREILQNERKLLEDQSDKYYARIDTLINRTVSVLGIFGAIGLGLFIWQFGKTRRDERSGSRTIQEAGIGSY